MCEILRKKYDSRFATLMEFAYMLRFCDDHADA